MAMVEARRRLLWHGMFLVLLGLCTGLFELQFSNPRLGLAAHLEGVMNGILLLAFGAAWMEIHLGTRTKVVAYWTALYGAYSSWAFTVLAATSQTGGFTKPSPEHPAWRSGDHAGGVQGVWCLAYDAFRAGFKVWRSSWSDE